MGQVKVHILMINMVAGLKAHKTGEEFKQLHAEARSTYVLATFSPSLPIHSLEFFVCYELERKLSAMKNKLTKAV